MNPWPQGCQRLMTAMIVCIELYTSDFREPPATPEVPGFDGYARRLWQSWGGRWRAKAAKKRRPIDGYEVATELRNWRNGEDVFRDVLLVQALIEGQEKARTLFVDTYMDPMIEAAERASRRFASDACTNAVSRLVTTIAEDRGLGNYNGQSPLLSYLKQVAVNEVRSQAKRKSARSTNLEPDHLSAAAVAPASEPEPDRSECERLLGTVLRQAVHRLSSGLQQTLYWRLKERRPVREVGKLLGIHYARVSARMTEAQESLKAYLSAAGNRPGHEGASIRACQETEFQGRTFAALVDRLLEILEELQGRGERS